MTTITAEYCHRPSGEHRTRVASNPFNLGGDFMGWALDNHGDLAGVTWGDRYGRRDYQHVELSLSLLRWLDLWARWRFLG